MTFLSNIQSVAKYESKSLVSNKNGLVKKLIK